VFFRALQLRIKHHHIHGDTRYVKRTNMTAPLGGSYQWVIYKSIELSGQQLMNLCVIFEANPAERFGHGATALLDVGAFGVADDPRPQGREPDEDEVHPDGSSVEVSRVGIDGERRGPQEADNSQRRGSKRCPVMPARMSEEAAYKTSKAEGGRLSRTSGESSRARLKGNEPRP
jgi:hypothetical protein